MCNVKIQIHLYETYIKFSFTLIFDELYSHNQTLCLHCKLCSLRTNTLEKSKSTKLIELIQILITYLSYLFRKAAKIKKNENMYTVDIYSYELRKRVLVYV